MVFFAGAGVCFSKLEAENSKVKFHVGQVTLHLCVFCRMFLLMIVFIPIGSCDNWSRASSRQIPKLSNLKKFVLNTCLDAEYEVVGCKRFTRATD